MFRGLLVALLIVGNFVYAEEVEVLDLDVIAYEKFIQGDLDTLEMLDRALHEKGIVGMRGVPGYREKYEKFIQAAREFHSLPEEVKGKYQPNRSITSMGYEIGKEKFQRPDGNWMVDDLKTSYYAIVPDNYKNIWPNEMNLREPFEELGEVMAQVGERILYKIGLLGGKTGLHLDEDSRIARMLYYRKSKNNDNPFWCGAHLDHGLFTVLLPAIYFVRGEQIAEPSEAGLFIRVSDGAPFKKVRAEDYDVMLFQVGEFGQLATDDAIRATEHRVHKAVGEIERYTLALFFSAPWDVPIYSQSVLTRDARYGGMPGEACYFRNWHEATLKRYLVEEKQ